MARANSGDVVTIHYTGKLEDGTVFDTSQQRDPLQFTLGEDGIIPGFQEAVQGMEEGEVRTTVVPPEQAYGERRDELVLAVSPEQFPPEIEPEVGRQLHISTPTGESIPVLITEIQDDVVQLDANHPLAGKRLFFEIELVRIG